MTTSSRTATLTRTTKETKIDMTLNLDGTGKTEINVPIGFLRHMLELFTAHSKFDLTLTASGDIDVDDHHLIEDIGIVLGKLLKESLQEKCGIYRYGSMILPMDEVLCLAAVDLSGRFSFETNYAPIREKVNDFSTEMVCHFFQSLAVNAEMNLHIQFLVAGTDEHHRIEAAFKSVARALKQAVKIDPEAAGQIPSTKGILT
jgi:imidazoleglycerol-phosphate dehydratase